MPHIPAFDELVDSLSQMTSYVEPGVPTVEKHEVKLAARSLASLEQITIESLAQWVNEHPAWGSVLGLAVGLSQEKLKNTLKSQLGSASWSKLARTNPKQLISKLDESFGLVRQVEEQRHRSYDFGDVLVARAGTRKNAVDGAVSGRKLEDQIEEIARDLGLPYETRTRFVGRNNQTGPCDLVIPSGQSAVIAVAAKSFDSTGSKLTAAYDEIREMANVRQPRQFIVAVIDGIGWRSRLSDLRRIYDLWVTDQIDGVYTLATLEAFKNELEHAARLRRLL